MFGREVKAKVENKNQNVYNLQRNTKVLAAYDGCGGTKQGGDIAGMWDIVRHCQTLQVCEFVDIVSGIKWTHSVTQVSPIIFGNRYGDPYLISKEHLRFSWWGWQSWSCRPARWIQTGLDCFQNCLFGVFVFLSIFLLRGVWPLFWRNNNLTSLQPKANGREPQW